MPEKLINLLRDGNGTAPRSRSAEGCRRVGKRADVNPACAGADVEMQVRDAVEIEACQRLARARQREKGGRTIISDGVCEGDLPVSDTAVDNLDGGVDACHRVGDCFGRDVGIGQVLPQNACADLANMQGGFEQLDRNTLTCKRQGSSEPAYFRNRPASSRPLAA